MFYAPSARLWLALLTGAILVVTELPAQSPSDRHRPERREAGEATSRLERVLVSRTSLSYADLTLQGLASELREQFHINVMLDQGGLNDVGLSVSTRLENVDLSDVILEEAIELMLEPLELSFYVRSEVVIVTTPEKVEDHLDTVVYPVGDLVAVSSGAAISAGRFFSRSIDHDYDTLVEVITSSIEPDTWDEVGGAGAIEPYPHKRTLVISQTRRGHRLVRKLLADLRSVGGGPSPMINSGRLSEAWLWHRRATPQAQLPYVYQPDGAWSVPHQH